MHLLQWCAMLLQALVCFPLPFPVFIVWYVVTSLLISKPPDSVCCNLQTNSFPCFLMCLLLSAPRTIYCEWLNLPLEMLGIAATLKLRPAASSSVWQPRLNPGRSLHSTLSPPPWTPAQSDPDEDRYYSATQNKEEEMRNIQAVDQLQAPSFSFMTVMYSQWQLHTEHRWQWTVTAMGNGSRL